MLNLLTTYLVELCLRLQSNFNSSLYLKEEVETFNAFFQPTDVLNDSLIGSSVGLSSYQESFAVDPNEILRKDRFSVEFASSRICHPRHIASQQQLQHQQQQQLQQQHRFKEELQFSEDEDSVTPKSEPYSYNSSINDFMFNNNNNNNNAPQIIHSANSRLLNCSQMVYYASSPNSNVSSPNQIPPSPKMGGFFQPQAFPTSAPSSPINISGRRGKGDLHLNVKLVSTLASGI